jgi:hypothetical protein
MGTVPNVGTIVGLDGSGTLTASAEIPPSDFCWPNPINLVPMGPASTLIPMGPIYGLVPLGPILGLAVEDPC